MAFQVNGLSAKKSLLDQAAHFEHLKRELIIMARCYLQITGFSELNQRISFLRRDRERFFQIDVASPLKTLLGDREMTLGRARDVNHVWRSRFQQFRQIGKA